MSENNTPPSNTTAKSTPTPDFEKNEEAKLNNANITEAADMAPQGTYNNMAMNMQTTMTEEQIKRNEQTMKELEEKEKEEVKEQEEKEKKAMDMKNPDFSLGWTIGDTRCYMMLLQMIVAGACGVLLVLSYSQMTLDSANMCNDENKYDGPYDSETEGCPWPVLNVIIRLIGPGIGLIFALITMILSYWSGSAILRDMRENNDQREKVKKLEYFDLYNQYCMFKFMRYALGYCGYLQFISVGFDSYSFLVGNAYASKNNISNSKIQFQITIVVSVAVAILLRVSHDAMYQRVYKHKLKLNFGIQADKGYAGATVVDRENKVPIVEMGDTHHLGPTQADMQISIHAQQRQYLENQNKILASSAAPSVYSDAAPSVYSQSGLNHYNTQTMHSLTQQNLQHYNQNASAPAMHVPSQSQYK